MTAAKALYSELEPQRSTILETARQCARLTIPSLVPPGGTNSSSKLPQPYQSLGAYGVNNLSAKLLIALYPQGTSFFRYILPETIQKEAAAAPIEQRAETEKQLAALENRALQKFEASAVRPQKAEAMAHLIVAGNVLTFFPNLEEFRLFRIDQYVVRRDASGAPLDVVVLEKISPRGLSEEVRAACEVQSDSKTEIEVYTAIRWDGGRCYWHQEINGIKVPGSAGDSPKRLSPWRPLRWKAVPGSDYGRGHCEEYLGDLLSLEGLSQAIVEFAAIAAKVLLLVHPGAVTDIGDVNRANSGDAVAGRAEDIDVLQLDKYADFQVVQSVAKGLEERLSKAFLLRSGLIRDAERVTAEEIRATAQELEDTLGGVYTVLATEEQTPFTHRLLHVLTLSRDLPALPKGAVEPVVVTGFQALGRNHALNRLRGAIGDLNTIFGPEGALKLLKGSDVATRILLGWGVEDAKGLAKTADELAAEEAKTAQSAAMQAVVEKGVGPMVQGAMRPE